jgi:hypothetical protein
MTDATQTNHDAQVSHRGDFLDRLLDRTTTQQL